MARVQQIRRILYLREYLTSYPRPSASDVARAFGVSKRTIYRDLRLLRSALAEPPPPLLSSTTATHHPVPDDPPASLVNHLVRAIDWLKKCSPRATESV